VSNALGEAVIADFDGTLVRLPISWAALRESLSVARIEELWHDPDMRRWETVTRAEVDAARTAPPVPFVLEALHSVPVLAVLTNNDESAVETFLDRWPELRARVRTVVGRRALGGPKTDFAVFSSGYASCLRALEADGAPVAYVGDMSYELDYARRLGANVFDVNDLKAASQRPGKG
jgi:phosphoglycolate phosphatase-like HAD superfamily hydrolase